MFFFMLSMPAMAEEAPPALGEIEKKVSTELSKMDRDLAGLAKRLSGMDYKTQETRTLLGDLCRSYPYAVDCAAVDRNGRMVKVAPEAYTGFEGSDISSQEQIIRLHKTKRPVMSMVIRTVEGIDAVDIEHPIFSPRGEFAGSVSMLIRPEALFSHILVPVLRGMPVEAFVMQTDGRIIYDADKEEIGRMLFEDPMYKPFPQLVAVGTMAVRERSGAGSYEFKQVGSEKLVKKDAYWTTVGLHGTEWRLVVMHVRAGHAASPGEDAAKSRTVLHDDALRTLAQSAEMKEALYRKDDARVRDILRDFYSKHEGLYSVQWLDVHGINRYGYPEENSLIKFDMKTLRTASSKPMLEALASRKESTFDSPLVEGKTGTFFMVPAYEGTDYLGMIYTILLKK